MPWNHDPPIVGVGPMATRDHYVSNIVTVHEWIDDHRIVIGGDLRGIIVPLHGDNYEAQDIIRGIVRTAPDLMEALDFDAETSEFFCYASTLGAAQALVGIIMALYLDARDKA